MDATALANPDTGHWRARLELGFENRRDRTVLAHRKRFGPLSVQRPFYPEHEVCHVYLLHPPGGVVGGDELSINVEMHAGTRALITTPGAAKFYRSDGAFARQDINIKIESGADLEWLPQESILFRGARLRQKTRIELAEGARFTGCEMLCLGRPANGEAYDYGEAQLHTQIFRQGVPLQIESMRIKPELGRNGPATLRGYPVSGICYATPISSTHLQTLRASVEPPVSGDYFGLTLIGDLLIARFLGNTTLRAQQRFTALWKQLRPLQMSRPASVPRIWKT